MTSQYAHAISVFACFAAAAAAVVDVHFFALLQFEKCVCSICFIHSALVHVASGVNSVDISNLSVMQVSSIAECEMLLNFFPKTTPFALCCLRCLYVLYLSLITLATLIMQHWVSPSDL